MAIPKEDTWFLTQVHVHALRLQSYLRRKNVNSHDTQDLCQETYLRLLTANARPQQVKGFLLRTARNLLIDTLRHAKHVRLYRLANLDAVQQIDPERELIARNELAAFKTAILKLSPQRRQVLWLRRMHQHTVKEIAQHLQLAPKTVQAHLAHADRALAEQRISP